MARQRIRNAAILLTMAVALGAAGPPQRATVLVGPAAADVLHQCSRSVPERGEGWFRPTPRLIAALDLAAGSASRRADIVHTYAVEVVGIVRGGRRFVYGNYLPIRMQDGVKQAPRSATVVCDGGRQLFGIEIDASTGRLTHSAFNGPN